MLTFIVSSGIKFLEKRKIGFLDSDVAATNTHSSGAAPMKLSALPVLFTAAAFAVSPGYALAQHVDVGPGGVSVHGHGHGHGHVDNHHHVEKPSTSRSTWTITMMTTVKATSQ